MYTNYNIPQKSCCKPGNFINDKNYVPYNYNTTSYKTPNYTSSNFNNTTYGTDDRFIGGGFLAPFLLGGVGGYLLGRPNYGPGPGFGPGPIPVYFPPTPQPYPVPYSNTNIYY